VIALREFLLDFEFDPKGLVFVRMTVVSQGCRDRLLVCARLGYQD